jgi:hypothetical protein
MPKIAKPKLTKAPKRTGKSADQRNKRVAANKVKIAELNNILYNSENGGNDEEIKMNDQISDLKASYSTYEVVKL